MDCFVKCDVQEVLLLFCAIGAEPSPFSRVNAFYNNPFFSICCKFVLAFFLKIGFHLKGRPQKERLKNLFSSLKNVCVHVKRNLFLLCGLLCCLLRWSFFCWHYLFTSFLSLCNTENNPFKKSTYIIHI